MEQREDVVVGVSVLGIRALYGGDSKTSGIDLVVYGSPIHQEYGVNVYDVFR